MNDYTMTLSQVVVLIRNAQLFMHYVAFSLSEDEEERNIYEQENDEVTDNVDDTVLSLCSSNQQDNMETQHEDTVLIPEAQETMSLESCNITEEIHQSSNRQDRRTSTDNVVFVKVVLEGGVDETPIGF